MNDFKKSLQVPNRKQEIINKMYSLIEQQVLEIRNDESLQGFEKATQVDVLLDVIRFLGDYDEATKILNKELERRRLQQKYKASKVQGKYNRTQTKKETNQIINEER